MPNILDDVKAKPLDRWQKGIGQVLVNIYMNDISYSDYDDFDSFVNSNFVDRGTGQALTDGINGVWNHYLENGKDPNGSDSPKWRIYNEFENSTSKLGSFQDRLKQDVIAKFWHNSNQHLTPDEEEKLGHVCGLLAIQAAYKNGWLFDDPINDPNRVLSPSLLHALEGGNPPDPGSVDPPSIKVPLVLDESFCTYLTPLGKDEVHAVVDKNQDMQNQYGQLTLKAAEDHNNDVMSATAQSSDANQQYQTTEQVIAGVYGKLSIVQPGAGLIIEYENFRTASGAFAEAAQDDSVSASAAAEAFDNLPDDQKAEILAEVRGEDSSGESSDSGTDDPEHDDPDNESETDGEQEHSAGGAGHVH